MASLLQLMPLIAGLAAMIVAGCLMVRRCEKGELGTFARFEAVYLPTCILMAGAAAYFWGGPFLATPLDISQTGVMVLGFFVWLSIVILFVVLWPLFLFLFLVGAFGLPWAEIVRAAFMIIFGGMLGNVLGFVYAKLLKAE